MPRRLLAHLSGVLRRRRVARESDDELQFHVEMETEANRARGLSLEEARRIALRDLGGLTQTRESVGNVRMTLLDSVWQDIRYSLRSLRRSPGFAFVAVLVLTLGIGVNTAAFSVVNAIFFPRITAHDPDSLVYLFQIGRYGRVGVTTNDDTAFFKDHYDKAFTGMTSHWYRTASFTADDETSTVFGEVVSANYFDVVGVKPVMGAGFRPEDDDPASTSLSVVISHDLWTRRFRSDPNVIGRQVRIEDRTMSIAGVMGPGFDGLSDPWRPTRFWVTFTALFGTQRIGVGVIARLRPEVSVEQARAIVAVESAKMQRDRALRRSRPSPDWRPMPYVVRPVATVPMPFNPDALPIPAAALAALLAVGGIVLLIAATNIAGVLAARGVSRTSEIAVRQALGAGSPRLVRQMVAESTVLALVGGTVGLAVSQILIALFRVYTPNRFAIDVPFDLRVGLFTLAVCVGVGIVVGLAPALQSLKINVVAALAGTGSGTSAKGRRRLRHAVLVPQVALSIAMLVVAGVHGRSLLRTETADPGYRFDDVVVANVWHWDRFTRDRENVFATLSTGKPWQSSADRAERERNFYQAIRNSLRSLSPVGSAALTSRLPTFTSDSSTSFISEDALLAGSTAGVMAWSSEVSSNYFETMGMRVLRGRGFDDRDTLARPGVAVISETLEKRLWPAGNAIGRRLAVYPPPMTDRPPDWKEVIGVIAETSPILHERGERPMVYTSFDQSWMPAFSWVVAWGRGDQTSFIQQLRTTLVSADTFAEVRGVQSLREVVDELLYPRRLAAGILVASGVLGLLLACIGLYGVISHSVAQRLRELGIRTTLGADRGDILRLVMREAATVAILGALPGIALSLIALKLTSNLVGAVPTFDAIAFTVVPLLATAIVLAASYIPARRAARLDPMTILRSQ